jgi:hypothetical protein
MSSGVRAAGALLAAALLESSCSPTSHAGPFDGGSADAGLDATSAADAPETDGSADVADSGQGPASDGVAGDDAAGDDGAEGSDAAGDDGALGKGDAGGDAALGSDGAGSDSAEGRDAAGGDGALGDGAGGDASPDARPEGGAPVACANPMLVTGQVGRSVQTIVADDSFVYWSEKGAGQGPHLTAAIMKVPVTGGTPQPIYSCINQSEGNLVQDGANVYTDCMVDDGTKTTWLWRVPKDASAMAGTPLWQDLDTTLAANVRRHLYSPIETDGTSVYFGGLDATADGVFAVATTGGTPSLRVSGINGFIGPITVSGGQVYVFAPPTNQSGIGLWSAPASGGVAKLLLYDSTMFYFNSDTWNIAASDGYLYWRTSLNGGRLFKMAEVGGAATAIASLSAYNSFSTCSSSCSVVLRGGFAYFTDSMNAKEIVQATPVDPQDGGVPTVLGKVPYTSPPFVAAFNSASLFFVAADLDSGKIYRCQ